VARLAPRRERLRPLLGQALEGRDRWRERRARERHPRELGGAGARRQTTPHRAIFFAFCKNRSHSKDKTHATRGTPPTTAEKMDREATEAVSDRAGETRESVRAKFVDEIPKRYSPALHLAATTGVGVTLLVLGAVFIRHLRPEELLLVPAMIVLANGWE